MKMEGGAEIGAEGKIRYRFSDPEQAKIATTLAHFACFSGIGRKNSDGDGASLFGEWGEMTNE